MVCIHNVDLGIRIGHFAVDLSLNCLDESGRLTWLQVDLYTGKQTGEQDSSEC